MLHGTINLSFNWHTDKVFCRGRLAPKVQNNLVLSWSWLLMADQSDAVQMIREESVVYLLDEAFLDIEAYFGDLLTSKWQSGSQAYHLEAQNRIRLRFLKGKFRFRWVKKRMIKFLLRFVESKKCCFFLPHLIITPLSNQEEYNRFYKCFLMI